MAAQDPPHLIMAPLRGLTDKVFRDTFNRHFKEINEAVTPFVASLSGNRRRIKPAYLKDLIPESGPRWPVVPQILSNNADDFIFMAKVFTDLGYTEINWNLGCPYPMVAKKKRGSGLLPFPDRVDQMLDEIHQGFSGKISVKIRLGYHAATEADALIPIFNQYPLARIIIHPRTGVQMYTGTVDLDAASRILPGFVHPVVYNGDITTAEIFHSLSNRFPTLSQWMIGRGLLSDPFLGETIQSGVAPSAAMRRKRFSAFHDDLVEGYTARFLGPGHVLDRMKGLWGYFSAMFQDKEKILKKVRKSKSLEDYAEKIKALMDAAKWA
ncbi:tRNA-dihydrouridine synthase family protein [Desulfosarcina sp. OttesenSCG-928-A07]|nr:tRNA-dihydrouridine synthase family protein [Desulfosarcina sp. OttesenSCG-928-G17]MDL2330164.1 tRNA-dihydrouridine synthase family protein [Desulfosarcina sp. OttesenSCG-928-A07]